MAREPRGRCQAGRVHGPRRDGHLLSGRTAPTRLIALHYLQGGAAPSPRRSGVARQHGDARHRRGLCWGCEFITNPSICPRHFFYLLTSRRTRPAFCVLFPDGCTLAAEKEALAAVPRVPYGPTSKSARIMAVLHCPVRLLHDGADSARHRRSRSACASVRTAAVSERPTARSSGITSMTTFRSPPGRQMAGYEARPLRSDLCGIKPFISAQQPD